MGGKTLSVVGQQHYTTRKLHQSIKGLNAKDVGGNGSPNGKSDALRQSIQQGRHPYQAVKLENVAEAPPADESTDRKASNEVVVLEDYPEEASAAQMEVEQTTAVPASGVSQSFFAPSLSQPILSTAVNDGGASMAVPATAVSATADKDKGGS